MVFPFPNRIHKLLPNRLAPFFKILILANDTGFRPVIQAQNL